MQQPTASPSPSYPSLPPPPHQVPPSVVYLRPERGPSEHRLAYSVACWGIGLGTLALGSTLHLAVDAIGGQDIEPALSAFWLTFLVVAAPFALWATNAVMRIESTDADAVHSQTRASLTSALLWGAGIVGIGRLLLGVYRLIYGLLNATADGAEIVADLAHVAVTVGVAGALFYGTWTWRHRADADAS